MTGSCREGAAVMSVLREVEEDFHPRALPPEAFRNPLEGFPRVERVLALGKAAAGLAQAAFRAFGRIPGLSYGVAGGGALPPGWIGLEGDHPDPSPGNVERTAEVRLWLEKGRGPLLVLVSGGTSALLVEPVPPWDRAEKALLASELLKRGASIEEVNALRVRLSRVKGGGLLSSAGSWPAATGIWSDVGPGAERSVGSGPTLPWRGKAQAEEVLDRYGLLPPRPLPPAVERRPRRGDRAFVLRRPVDLRREVAARLRRIGCAVTEWPVFEGTRAEDLASELARRWRPSSAGRRRRALVGAGEATVGVPSGAGKGGRCSHLAAAVALQFLRAGRRRWAFAALATDGVDGTGDGGAFTCAWCAPPQEDLEAALRTGDTAALWRREGGFVPGKPTGNNLRDLWALVETEEP